jgi:hypothetical protein
MEHVCELQGTSDSAASTPLPSQCDHSPARLEYAPQCVDPMEYVSIVPGEAANGTASPPWRVSHHMQAAGPFCGTVGKSKREHPPPPRRSIDTLTVNTLACSKAHQDTRKTSCVTHGGPPASTAWPHHYMHVQHPAPPVTHVQDASVKAACATPPAHRASHCPPHLLTGVRMGPPLTASLAASLATRSLHRTSKRFNAQWQYQWQPAQLHTAAASADVRSGCVTAV